MAIMPCGSLGSPIGSIVSHGLVLLLRHDFFRVQICVLIHFLLLGRRSAFPVNTYGDFPTPTSARLGPDLPPTTARLLPVRPRQVGVVLPPQLVHVDQRARNLLLGVGRRIVQKFVDERLPTAATVDQKYSNSSRRFKWTLSWVWPQPVNSRMSRRLKR